jgi:crotonobetainyl-CoA:carnitine CoA-transferase CaiB-like acyl-CoA transferase
MNVYRSADDTWFVLLVTPDKLVALAQAIDRADLLKDPRFSDPAKLVANMPELTAILDEVFAARPMAHWQDRGRVSRRIARAAVRFVGH